jgi:hypothetical protein
MTCWCRGVMCHVTYVKEKSCISERLLWMRSTTFVQLFCLRPMSGPPRLLDVVQVPCLGLACVVYADGGSTQVFKRGISPHHAKLSGGRTSTPQTHLHFANPQHTMPNTTIPDYVTSHHALPRPATTPHLRPAPDLRCHRR